MKARTLLALAGGLFALVALPVGPAMAQSSPKLLPVKMSFLVRPSGSAANFVASQDKGFFREEGLDVSFIVPANPAAALQLVAAGTVQFAVAHSTDVILARSRQLPIVSIGTTHQFGTAGIMAPAAKNVHTPKALEGMTVGITGIPANRVMLEYVLRVNNVDMSRVKLVPMGFTLAPALLAGRIDAIGDAITWAEPITYNLKMGKDANDASTYSFLPFYKHGAPRYYTFGVIASESYLAANADVARRFMRGWAKGIEWTRKNQTEAVDMLIKRYSAVERGPALGVWKVLEDIVVSDETKAHGTGWQDPEVWRKQAKFMLEQKLIPAAVDVSKAMTNEYLPGK